MKVSIDSSGLDALSALWETAPDITRQELERATTEALLLLERETKEGTPKGVTDVLIRSISARAPESLADSVIGVVGSTAAHAAPVETGSKPHFPPVEPLVDWVRAKLDIKTEEEVNEVALLIARKIAARGTEGVRMFGKAFERSQPYIEQMYLAGVTRIRDRLADV